MLSKRLWKRPHEVRNKSLQPENIYQLAVLMLFSHIRVVRFGVAKAGPNHNPLRHCNGHVSECGTECFPLTASSNKLICMLVELKNIGVEDSKRLLEVSFG